MPIASAASSSPVAAAAAAAWRAWKRFVLRRTRLYLVLNGTS